MKRLLPLLLLSLCSLPAFAADPDLTTFETVLTEHYEDAARGFSLDYPYRWQHADPQSPQEVFGVAELYAAPSLRVTLRPRIEALPLEQSAAAAAKALGDGATLSGHKTITLNGVKAQVVVADWVVPVYSGLPIRTMFVSAYRGDDWFLITAADGQVGKTLMPELMDAVNSVRIFEPAK